MPDSQRSAYPLQPPRLTACPKCGSASVDLIPVSWKTDFVYVRCEDCAEVWPIRRDDPTAG